MRRRATRRRDKARAVAQVSQALMRTQTHPPTRYRFFDIGADKVLERALGPGVPSLAGKRITLIGAGSVGSHLGMALARCGAGVAPGNLTIFDGETVTVENLARSVYDSRHIGVNKARALCQMLEATLYGASFTPIEAAAGTDVSQLEADLVI